MHPLRAWGSLHCWPGTRGNGTVATLAVWLGLLLEGDNKTARWWWGSAVRLVREVVS